MADLEKITDLIETAEDMAPAGFAIAFHIRMTSSEFQFQTYPKAWMDLYNSKGFIMSDPTVGWAFANTGSIRWSALSDQDALKIYEQSADFGIKYGTAIGVEAGGSRSIAGFARPDREYTDAEMQTLTDHVQDLHSLTASETGMTPEVRAELHKLSVRMTHPS
ncbi:autoinducer binding domain-containing protein [Pseudooctadecabacter jejudonensis]|uniref:DNA-binding transcriptional activator SdiA n=1 Tax=Pseudooctadecabacter jejudonensis TaxID=1391910 RepID=A0A1Y5TAG6_9RHOB|nr:autoinducer binding domain-containing protein [Pseudooctadecabacter jejudonensis]SLN59256.1 DNA-binding transcriptional activator SdiA [Pseudooctadecabacter jejudonensis]